MDSQRSAGIANSVCFVRKVMPPNVSWNSKLTSHRSLPVSRLAQWKVGAGRPGQDCDRKLGLPAGLRCRRIRRCWPRRPESLGSASWCGGCHPGRALVTAAQRQSVDTYPVWIGSRLGPVAARRKNCTAPNVVLNWWNRKWRGGRDRSLEHADGLSMLSHELELVP